MNIKWEDIGKGFGKFVYMAHSAKVMHYSFDFIILSTALGKLFYHISRLILERNAFFTYGSKVQDEGKSFNI